MATERTLFFFTSNIRERYVVDALAAIAHPPGTQMRFRYDQQHVAADLRARWTQIEGFSALIHLSIQHAERFHDSAFIPLREAKVIRTDVRGDMLTVDLELGSYFAFAGLPPELEATRESRSELGRRIRGYSALLREDPQYPSPDDDQPRSAGFGPPLTQLQHLLGEKELPLASGDDLAFRALVDYLSATLTNPERIYFRVVGIRAIDSNTFLKPKDGEYWLTSGESYVVEVVHRQVNLSVVPAELRVQVGEGVSNRDVEELAITSAYDAFSLVIDVPNRPDTTRSYLELFPNEPGLAASVRLSLVLAPSNAQRFGIPAAGAVATGAVAFAATDMLPKNCWGVALAIGAALAVFCLGVWQTRRGLKILP